MTTIVKEIYDAFIEAGVNKETAEKAAESLNHQEDGMKEIKNELKLHRWMLGLIIGLLLTIVIKYLLS